MIFGFNQRGTVSRVATLALGLVLGSKAFAGPAVAYGQAWSIDDLGDAGPDITWDWTTNITFNHYFGPVYGPGAHGHWSDANYTSLGPVGGPSVTSYGFAEGVSADGIEQYSQDNISITNNSFRDTEAFTVTYTYSLYSTAYVSDSSRQYAENYSYFAFVDNVYGWQFYGIDRTGVVDSGSQFSTNTGSRTYYIPPQTSIFVIVQSGSGVYLGSNVPAPAAAIPFVFGAVANARRRRRQA